MIVGRGTKLVQVQVARIIVLGITLLSSVTSAGGQQTRAPGAVGSTAANFSVTDLNNRKVSLRAYRGRVVLLNFWATWCGPCLIELPRFGEWQKLYGSEQFQVIAISMDDSEEPVRRVSSRLKLNYPIAMGDERLGSAYGDILGLPVTLLIDRKGHIRYKHRGEVDLKTLESEIQQLLAVH